jgi:hypothetical protein
VFAECLEDWIDDNNPARVTDVCVDELTFWELGFDGAYADIGIGSRTA